jgi:cytochrome c biogenesis factor
MKILGMLKKQNITLYIMAAALIILSLDISRVIILESFQLVHNLAYRIVLIFIVLILLSNVLVKILVNVIKNHAY